MYHNPVLLHESVEGLGIRADGVYVDVTYGGGGHSKAILKQLQTGRLYAFDQDQDAASNIMDDKRLTFIPQNFKYLKNFLLLHGEKQVDGILADLGVSSFQFDVAEKGFSTRFDGKLDMRMDQNNPIDASTIVNTYSETELKIIFEKYGELPKSYRMASTIVEARSKKAIQSTFELKEVVKRFLPFGKENKILAQLFQALRIEVNQEMQALEAFLEQSIDMLKPGGRLVVISYHSLEDRLVKNFIKSGNASGQIEKDFFGNNLSPFNQVNRKAIVPDEKEIAINGRARSAKLRIAEKKAQ
ncbi:MAG: 16S rRNA (cytosine(1402)-N(4))-methyltransferase [Bacteroidetes bacterium HGW-Bacteroidetes-1]|jgi:16S rRNA (cytosine1402-N4)-methyltransferase|nr:MAG: 16S rRNA (cytosine(1402)-N(4))-methyltransferase [Bacteroidetes bacterium HGW-Bacteroidetes-1]